MDAKEMLGDMGLSYGEIETYLALLKLGSVPVSKIKKTTNLHRTAIYDFLEKLMGRGLVNYVIKDSVKYYKASNPNKLLELVKEKEDNVNSILPELLKLSMSEKEDIKVEVYKGIEGFKTFLNDVTNTGKDLVGLGIDELKFNELSPNQMEQYFRREEEKGMKERLLTNENAELIFRKSNIRYKFIPSQYFNPTPTLVYGNKISIVIWEPLTVIMIENPGLADSYRNYFEMLWKIADNLPKSKRLKEVFISKKK